MSRKYAENCPQIQQNEKNSVRRRFDDSIDFRYYQRRAHCLRSEAAWDIIRYMSHLLPFNRNDDEPLHLKKPNCTMM